MKATENYREGYKAGSKEGFTAGASWIALVGSVTLVGLSSILGNVYENNTENVLRNERISATELTAKLCNYSGGNEMLRDTTRGE